MRNASLRFDRGTICVEGAGDRALELPSVIWDPRALAYRAPAHAAVAIVQRASAAGISVSTHPWPAWTTDRSQWVVPPLRPYQQGALDAWHAFGRRGVVVIPTGGGKTRVAIAAAAALRAPAVFLCPTRALLAQWRRELAAWYGGPIGVVGDGERQVEAITVMTFESAYRTMDELGDRFALLVVDEVHHFSGDARAEALEMCAAPLRLGLTATAPLAESAAAASIEALVGPVVSEVALDELLGTHLADLDVTRMTVRLTMSERAEYARAMTPFAELRRAFSRTNPGADWASLVHALGRSVAGRAALAGFHQAVAIAAFPEAKRALVRRLVERHRDDKALVFTPSVEAAYRVGRDCLVPVLSSETTRREREAVLARFRDGTVRAIVSARVLNEGLDVPDARVAVLAGGTLGAREVVQRVGRVLRRSPGKRAHVYELISGGTIDDRRAESRRRRLAAGCAALG